MSRVALERELQHLQDEILRLGSEVEEHLTDVDELYRRVYQQIMNYLARNPTSFEFAHRLEWAAHNLERSADRVINICEWVAYMVTGKFVEFDLEQTSVPTA